jgi:hypothetical protein
MTAVNQKQREEIYENLTDSMCNGSGFPVFPERVGS